MMQLPKVPMAPVTRSDIPIGPEWRYQIKWDGSRTLARLDGGVELFSKRIEPTNLVFPEIVDLLLPLRSSHCVVDGEIAEFDGERPNFQRSRQSSRFRKYRETSFFCAFDLLYYKGKDIRHLPFIERYKRLQSLLPDPNPRLFVSDIFEDGPALWDWVNQHEWEGIISKRIDSPYVEGKDHEYWFKKRKELRLNCDVVGIKLKDGYISSLLLRYKDKYVGHVSSGLDSKSKKLIMEFAQQHPGDNPFDFTPKYKVLWLSVPFIANVSALEFTDNGLLRQAKLRGYGI